MSVSTTSTGIGPDSESARYSGHLTNGRGAFAKCSLEPHARCSRYRRASWALKGLLEVRRRVCVTACAVQPEPEPICVEFPPPARATTQPQRCPLTRPPPTPDTVVSRVGHHHKGVGVP